MDENDPSALSIALATWPDTTANIDAAMQILAKLPIMTDAPIEAIKIQAIDLTSSVR
jgi:hypothetical protein